MRTDDQIKQAALDLRQHLTASCGKDVLPLVPISVRNKITSTALLTIDTTINSYQPEELAKFLACWEKDEKKASAEKL